MEEWRNANAPIAHFAQDGHEEAVVAEAPGATAVRLDKALEDRAGLDVYLVLRRAGV